MIKLNKKTQISIVQKNNQKSTAKQQSKKINSAFRPEVVDAKVYKVKSAFVKNSVFITLGYTDSLEFGRKPIEIFINSKDLNKAPEFVVLTRLISAIFRRATDPMFILEELHGIHDPNGGSFKEGKYYHSFYAEVAETIERFFYDVGIIKEKTDEQLATEETQTIAENKSLEEELIKEEVPSNSNIEQTNAAFKICPDCNSKSLKNENGCDSCIQCGYSKCDK